MLGAVIVLQLDLKLCSNPLNGEVYSIQYYVTNFDCNLREVGGFLQVLRFPPPIKLTPRYN
jgi:hypothetical protein